LVFASHGKIFNVKVEKYMDDIEGEAVVRQVSRNREGAPIFANFGERDRPGRRGVRLAPRSCRKASNPDVQRDAKHGGRDGRAPHESKFTAFAFIRVYSRFYMQVVNFPGFSRFFSIVADISHVVLPMGKTSLAGADPQF